MALLMYDAPPEPQFLKNSSFETTLSAVDITDNWVVNTEVLRQSEVVAFGSFAAELAPGGVVYQRGSYLSLTGSVAVSTLVRGKSSEQVSQLFVRYEQLNSSGQVLNEKTRRLASPSSLEFNIAYAVFNLPQVTEASEARVTFFTTEGGGTYYLDNTKVELGRRPTRWSPSENEPDIEVPTEFSISTPFFDPVDVFSGSINTTDVLSFPQKVTSNPDGTVPQQDRSGQPVPGRLIGRDCGDAFSQYHEFIEKSRKIEKKDMDQSVNREPTKWYPWDEDPEFTKFERDKLQTKVDDPNINSRQKTFVAAAKTKMALQRRMFEVRNHARMDHYSFGFNDKWHNYKHLRYEDGQIRFLVTG